MNIQFLKKNNERKDQSERCITMTESIIFETYTFNVLVRTRGKIGILE